MKRSMAARSYSTRVTRSSPGLKSFGGAEARRTPPPPGSHPSCRATSSSSWVNGSSTALPRALSKRAVTNPPVLSSRMPLTKNLLKFRRQPSTGPLEQGDLLGRLEVAVALRVQEAVLRAQGAHARVDRLP